MNTVPTSRLPFFPGTGFPSVNTFGEFSNFLRSALADEDSRIFSDSISEVAMHAEAVLAALRLNRRRDAMAPLLMDMLTVLRDHRTLVVNLDLAWRGLYEYAAYLQALNNFRVLIGQWLLNTTPWDDDLGVTAEDFELAAWRTMGEGMLLVDMYEQWLRQETRAGCSGQDGDSQPERVVQWWHKLRR